VEAVTGVDWVAGRRDAAFERARAAEAISTENRFRGLLDRHETRLRKVAYAMLADPNRVEDVLQEALIRAHLKLPTRFESERHEAAWLYRIVYRCCLDDIRRSRRRPETSRLNDDAAVVTTEDISDSYDVVRALAELAPDQRAVVLLVDLIGFDYEDAATVLGIPRGTVAWRLHVARSRLRVVLGDLGVVVDD
jgi:RNA polymerase sigma-70 factor (ECF subfamily)